MIRKATMSDVQAIQDLINYYAKKDRMLPRSLNEIYENLQDFWVYEEKGKLLGCCALHPSCEDLAEVRSLAVAEACHKKGVGSKLVKEALAGAKVLKVKKVFALTYVPEFFEKLGFKKIEHSKLPHKIWSDCIKCVKFPNCDENSLEIDI
jgi:amino-acid N-acetyltransferase